jgi:hypothetical protein
MTPSRRPRFADTSFYVALLSPGDENHAAARSESECTSRVVTTDFILLEAANFLVSRGRRDSFLALYESVRSDPRTRVLPAARRLLEQGVELLSQRPDKQWSLTDCTSIIVMRSMELEDVLTADHHFAQAGFNVLLR